MCPARLQTGQWDLVASLVRAADFEPANRIAHLTRVLGDSPRTARLPPFASRSGARHASPKLDLTRLARVLRVVGGPTQTVCTNLMWFDLEQSLRELQGYIRLAKKTPGYEEKSPCEGA
jgi:hypothetical protein